MNMTKPLLDEHFLRMTDDTGMYQHTRFAMPDYGHGYTTDDNARALIVAVQLHASNPDNKYLELIYKYLSFLNYALTADGKFKNFMGFNRVFIEEEGSEDCFGRCVWALATVSSSSDLPKNAYRMARHMLSQMEVHFTNLTYLRAKAYTLVGVCLLKDAKHLESIHVLASDLQRLYHENSRPDWRWFEQSMTYSNAMIPCALFLAYEATQNQEYYRIAVESFDFSHGYEYDEWSF
jgi:hypothetical protein